MLSLSRNAWVWILLSFWVSPALALPEDAEGGQPAEDQHHLDAFDDEALFVIGNTLFTVYHELGHALIDLLDLPVIGREEDAVDGFAAVTMIPKTPDPVRDALIVAVADGWRAQSDFAADGRAHLFWGEHALNEQRHFAVVCLMVGSDQEGFYDFALEAGLPDERIRTCSRDFSGMKSGWERLLGPHRPGVEVTGGSSWAAPITLAFDQPPPKLSGLDDLIREGGLLENAILGFGDDIALPSPVVVRFTTCKERNAFWSRARREVAICYELIDGFEAIFLGSALH
ncbi:MAG: DUF4344 domain-containing metallopeptidase [Geminicoccaceae bacterium]